MDITLEPVVQWSCLNTPHVGQLATWRAYLSELQLLALHELAVPEPQPAASGAALLQLPHQLLAPGVPDGRGGTRCSDAKAIQIGTLKTFHSLKFGFSRL